MALTLPATESVSSILGDNGRGEAELFDIEGFQYEEVEQKVYTEACQYKVSIAMIFFATLMLCFSDEKIH